MDKYEKKNRINEALKLRGLKAVDLVEKSGVSKSSLSSYMSQRWQPKQKPLVKMAKVLNVSELWLAGYDVPMERPIEQIKMDDLALLINEIRKDERLKNLFINISKLNNDHKQVIENMVHELIKVDSHLH